ncbi:YqkE family protein [Virgibacillus senegalensis]|uniref:YqkE family protein n=1 Tax=Virgibacillus senegalensis TaxID=1499679 RepID=UPI00069EB6D0|nr:YqkE family protein [Virgibacillus senegalensis]
MAKKSQNGDTNSLKERLDPELVNKLSSKKKELKKEEQAKLEQEKQRKAEERKIREANKSFEELLKESDLDWHQYK